jgi:outer membrane protein OmpA-like peptidoglycan-associated protein
MKKTVSLLALLIAVLPALVFAYPGIGGGRGLLRVQNALVEDEAGLTISMHALGRNLAFPDATDKKGWVADVIAPELSYAPVVTKYAGLELFGSWGGVFQTPKSATEADFTMATHDLKAGGKVSIPVLPVLKLGFAGSYTFMTGRDDPGMVWLDPLALPLANDPAFTWNGLATLQLQDLLPSAPNLMFNYGKIDKETRYGAGLQLAAKGFSLFLEALSQQPEHSGMFDTDSGHIHLTPGVVFGSARAFAWKVAYTFSFGNASVVPSPNELILGLVVGTPFGQRAPAEVGDIAATVTDARTGAALLADITFPDNPKLKPLQSDAGTGVFQVMRVPVGVVVVEAAADGYQRQAVPIDVKAGAATQYEFKLRPLVTYGTIAGTVIDATTNKPLAAKIEFPGTSLAAVTADASTGAFRVNNVPVGVYTITASATGYFSGSLTVNVEEGKVAAPTFSLTPEAMKATLTGKVSDKKDGTPLAATVSFPNTSVPSVKTDPGTGVYSTDIPVGSYAVEVTAEGYITQSAAVVLQKDKPIIKDFALVKVGMAITLRGVYFDFDKATIKPESRPALEDAAKILKDNPTIKVEIQGHTDSKGSEEYNLSLSDKRAWAVVNYLVQNFGIEQSRLTAKGYGEARPIADNGTDAGRALNRRVEFVIIGQTPQK